MIQCIEPDFIRSVITNDVWKFDGLLVIITLYLTTNNAIVLWIHSEQISRSLITTSHLFFDQYKTDFS